MCTKFEIMPAIREELVLGGSGNLVAINSHCGIIVWKLCEA